MLQKQKETILALLKSDEANKNYKRNYWFSYQDYLDLTDNFTDFSCENLDGKQEYITLIENLLNADETAKIFVQVYGLDEDNNDEFISADTLIVFSTLPLHEIKRIFNEPEDIFPSYSGRLVQHQYYNAFDEYYVKHNLGAMEKIFAGYVNERLDSYLVMLKE